MAATKGPGPGSIKRMFSTSCLFVNIVTLKSTIVTRRVKSRVDKYIQRLGYLHRACPILARPGADRVTSPCHIYPRAIGYLGGALAGQHIFYSVWVQIQSLARVVYTSRFGVFFDSSQNYQQITTACRIVLHAARSSQMPHAENINQNIQS